MNKYSGFLVRLVLVRPHQESKLSFNSLRFVSCFSGILTRVGDDAVTSSKSRYRVTSFRNKALIRSRHFDHQIGNMSEKLPFTRLSKDVSPINYSLRLQPNLIEFTFVGSEDIAVEVINITIRKPYLNSGKQVQGSSICYWTV